MDFNYTPSVLTSIGGQIAGVIASGIAVRYFIKLYNVTHRFSYTRLLLVFSVITILFTLFLFLFASATIEQNSLSIYHRIGLVIISLVFAAVGVIFSLGLGCSNKKGTLSKLACKVLNCHIRE